MPPRKYWTCTIEGCEKKHYVHGCCQMHYSRFKRYGTYKLKGRHRPPVADRFQEGYLPEPTSGCWLWKRAINSAGYGLIGKEGKLYTAHRISWELHNGPIPEGIQVCHKCDVKYCVNPDHLFLGTQKDNMDDAVRKGRVNYSKNGKKGAAAKWKKTPMEVK